MSRPKIRPYGSWSSPITAELVASESLRLFEITLVGERTTWIEMRPAEDGRHAIVHRYADGSRAEALPPAFSARTRVHEYGGGAYVSDGETLIFSNWKDQRLYRQDTGDEPQPITPQMDARYADGVIDRRRGRLIYVREDHTADGGPVNAIVAISLEGPSEGEVLISGNDFYASPRLSPDGRRLAWLNWNHPNMPWQGTELWVGEVEDGLIVRQEQVAGGAETSIFQPQWSPDGLLYFVSDRTNWWNLYRLREGKAEHLVDRAAEFGRPQWVFGMSTYDFASAERMVCSYTQDGIWHLGSLDLKTLELIPFDLPYTDISYVRATAERTVFRGGSPTEPLSVVELDLNRGDIEILRRSTEVPVGKGYLSGPRAVEFHTANGRTAYGFYYAPKNLDYQGPPEARPPLLVISHGGPTSATTSTLDLEVQYWTSRGIAVLDVNYRGSTGYGRAYRRELEGEWGVADMEDCVNGARYLADQNEVDGQRLLIRGGSAGGYTTLRALTSRQDFAAGASYYGVSDLKALTEETHKFESHYLDRLVGPYPEQKDLYRERSPLYHADEISCPVIFLQGAEDQVVPPDQAELMADALREKGLPVAYLLFEGEQHGFRRAKTIQRALEAELSFYAQVLGFEPAEHTEPVDIEGL